MKLLFIDIETAPNIAYVWGLFKQNVSISQIQNSARMLCWAAKWEGEKEVMFSSEREGREAMLKRMWNLLDQADAVCHYNGAKFDIPTLNAEFLLAGMPPPSPYKQIDLLRTSRGAFRFPSNKLDYVAQRLGIGQKTAHEGFELWIKCMDATHPKHEAAWRRMERYNRKDVVLLERLYQEFRPWIKGHPNRTLYTGGQIECPTCGCQRLQQRGVLKTLTGTRQRYACTRCGAWSSRLITDRAVPMRSAA